MSPAGLRGRGRHQIVEITNVGALERHVGNDQYRSRDVLDVLQPLAGGNDHFFDETGPLRNRFRGRRRCGL